MSHRLYVPMGVLLASSITTVVSAQTATLLIEAETEQLTPGQVFLLEIRADVENGDTDNLKLPNLDAFEVLGHDVSTPMQFSFSFGFGGAVRTMRSTVIHRFKLRAPTAQGRHSIGPAILRLKGKAFTSNVVTVTVAGVGSTQPNGTMDPTRAIPPEGELTGAHYDSKAFIRTVIDNKTPYVGEQVTVSFFLYLDGTLRASPVVTQEPTMQGFWTHNLLASARALEPTVQLVNGQPFRVYLLRRIAAFALDAGKTSVGAMRVTIPTGSIFDVFNGSPPKDFERASNDIVLSIKPLPSHGPPTDAPVHIGSIALSAAMDRTEIATLDAVKFRIIAQGTGNLAGLNFQLPAIPGLQLLAPETHDEVRAVDGVVSGTRTMEWLVIPQQPGNYTIPAINVHVWNPQTPTFTLTHSEPISLRSTGKGVAPGTDAIAPDAIASPTFGPIRLHSKLTRYTPPFVQNPWYLALMVLPALGTLFVYVATQSNEPKKQKRHRNIDKKSALWLQDCLKQLESTESWNNPQAFYTEMARVLQSALETHLGIHTGNLTRGELSERLQAQNMPPPILHQWLTLMDHADAARFGSTIADRTQMQIQLETLKQLIGFLDLKKNPHKEAL